MTYDSTILPAPARSLVANESRSTVDLLPSIDFAFDDLRKRMAHFTTRFDASVETGHQQVLQEKNHFRAAWTESREDQRYTMRSVEIETDKCCIHKDYLARESVEKVEMHSQISSLASQQRVVTSQNLDLITDLKALQITLEARKDAQIKHLRYLASQSRRNEPELVFWEDHLRLRIEGLGMVDRLKFVFSHLLEKDWERTAYFELDTSSREYKVPRIAPTLDSLELQKLVDYLNESRELGTFLKGIRDAFLRVMR